MCSAATWFSMLRKATGAAATTSATMTELYPLLTPLNNAYSARTSRTKTTWLMSPLKMPRRKSDSFAAMLAAVAAASPGTMSEGTYSMLKPPVTARSRYSNPAVLAVPFLGFIAGQPGFVWANR